MKKTTLTILIAGAAAILAAGGIFLWKQEKPASPVEARDHGQAVSVCFSQGHMVRTECFRFSLEEKEGKYFLSGDFFDEREENIVLEHQEVPAKTMEDLRGLLEKKNVPEFVEQYSSRKKPFARDETIFEIEIRWEDGTVSSADSHGSFGPALRRFFEEVCLRYQK